MWGCLEGLAEQRVEFFGILLVRAYLQLSVIWQFLPSCELMDKSLTRDLLHISQTPGKLASHRNLL